MKLKVGKGMSTKQVQVEDVALEDHDDAVVQLLLEEGAGETRR